jgi:signal transduction histidine kinase
MLALARAESPISAAGQQPVADLAGCVERSVEQLETVAALRRVRVALDVPPSTSEASPSVALPPGDCNLLVSNLLLNALQHSPPESIVELTVTADSEIATLVIRDHGDGILPEALPHIFDRFYRGDPSRTRNTGGTGLGLAIAKAIVQRAGGSIVIASQPDPALPDRGTIVTLRLPAFSTA